MQKKSCAHLVFSSALNSFELPGRPVVCSTTVHAHASLSPVASCNTPATTFYRLCVSRIPLRNGSLWSAAPDSHYAKSLSRLRLWLLVWRSILLLPPRLLFPQWVLLSGELLRLSPSWILIALTRIPAAFEPSLVKELAGGLAGSHYWRATHGDFPFSTPARHESA